MDYRLLGPLEVIGDDGAPIVVPAPKRRALLAALLLEADRPVSTARLSEALWGDDTPPAAESSLQAHVSRLRRELGPAQILTQPAGYRVRIGAGQLDVRCFEDDLATASRAASLGRWREASDAYARALERWRGTALADIPCAGYLQSAAARLEDLRLTALEGRLDADLELGLHAARTAELASLVEEHPLRERFWHQLMLALYRSGRQADALAAYRRVRSILVGELGIDPSPDLQLLEGRILRQDPTLRGPVAGSIQSLHRLPLPPTSMIGRRDELERAVALLGSHRLLTLTGPGGVGKTRLGIVIAHALLGDFPDGVLFVDLASTRNPAEVIARIGEAIGGGERPAAVIGDRRILLVLDNFEQVVEAAADVAELLALCPALRILVTSRAPLRIGAEARFEVPPLSRSASVSLFEERGQAAIMGGAVRDETVVDDIVGRLDGLPLAIELAAARLRVLSPEALRDRLTDRLPLLTAGPRDAPPRHRTLRETISWSYDLLSPRARAAFRALSVAAGGFDLPAALAIGGTDVDVLAELVDESLVRRVDDRYSMLETIREFAVEQAAAEGDARTARDRHLAHYLAVAGSTHRNTTEGGSLAGNAWVAMCMTERENLRVAFDWAVARDDTDALLRLFRATGLFWLFVGAIDEGQRWGEATVAAARRLGDPARLRQPLVTLSEFPRFSGDPKRALVLKTEALDLARSAADHLDVAVTLDDMASIHTGLGDYALAHRLLDEAMAIHERGPTDALSRAHTVVSVVELAVDERDVATADLYIGELARLEAQIELWPDWIVESDCLRAKVHHLAGRDDEAAPLFRSVVRDAVDIGFRMALVDSLDGLAAIESHADVVRAARLVGMADRLRAESRLRVSAPVELRETIATLATALGEVRYERLHAEGHALPLPAIVDAVMAPA